MKTWFAWYDETKRKSSTDLVLDAIDRYEVKFGKLAELVAVHPEVATVELPDDVNVRVIGSNYVQKYCAWVELP